VEALGNVDHFEQVDHRHDVLTVPDYCACGNPARDCGGVVKQTGTFACLNCRSRRRTPGRCIQPRAFASRLEVPYPDGYVFPALSDKMMEKR